MTKCQTNLLRKKKIHRFFGLFSTQNHSIRKKNIFEKFSFFWKFWPKMTLFGPNLGPNLVKMNWKYFFRFFRALNMKNDGSYDKISLILIFGHFRSKWAFWAERGWKGAYFWPKWPETCFIDFLAPKPLKMMGHMIKFARISKNGFWAILGPLGPKSREREFFRKNAWERFLPL